MRHLISSLVQLLIRESLIEATHRHAVWRAFRLLFDQFMNATGARVLRRSLIPVDQHAMTLRFAHDRELRDGTLRVLDSSR
jgi:hypothetical protein